MSSTVLAATVERSTSRRSARSCPRLSPSRAARNILANPLVRYGAKLCLVASRSVNSLVWALLFVTVFGPGADHGTVAITFRSIGFVGKLLQVKPAFLSIVLPRWDINAREPAVRGLVGAGGSGPC